MAMDIHLPHVVDQTTIEGSSHSESIDKLSKQLAQELILIKADSAQSSCVDASSHCSHNQAHSIGLLVITTVINTQVHTVPLSYINQKSISYTQAPPVRPPKA